MESSLNFRSYLSTVGNEKDFYTPTTPKEKMSKFFSKSDVFELSSPKNELKIRQINEKQIK